MVLRTQQTLEKIAKITAKLRQKAKHQIMGPKTIIYGIQNSTLSIDNCARF